MDPLKGRSTLSIDTVDASGYSSVHVGDSINHTEQTIGRDKFDHVSSFSQINHFSVVIGHARSATPDPLAVLRPPSAPARAESAPPHQIPPTQFVPADEHREIHSLSTSSELRTKHSRSAASLHPFSSYASEAIDWACLDRDELIEYVVRGTRVLLIGTLLTPGELRQTLLAHRTPVLRREAEAMHIACKCIEAQDSLERANLGSSKNSPWVPLGAPLDVGSQVSTFGAVSREVYWSADEGQMCFGDADEPYPADVEFMEEPFQLELRNAITTLLHDLRRVDSKSMTNQGFWRERAAQSEVRHMTQELSRAQRAVAIAIIDTTQETGNDRGFDSRRSKSLANDDGWFLEDEAL